MKRFIMNFVVGLVLIAGLVFSGCLASPLSQQIEETEAFKARPAHINRIEEKSNKSFTDKGLPIQAKIIRWEDDGYTLWLWIDHVKYPADCDYVVVLGIGDRATDKYKVLTVFSNKKIPNACEYASVKYEEYKVILKQEEKLHQEKTRKNGGI